MNPGILNNISNYLSKQPIEKAWVFGSYSREEENENSDIDLLVRFLPHENITLFRYVHIVNELEKLTGKKIDMVEDGQLKDFAVDSANADKILIYERKA